MFSVFFLQKVLFTQVLGPFCVQFWWNDFSMKSPLKTIFSLPKPVFGPFSSESKAARTSAIEGEIFDFFMRHDEVGRCAQ